MGERAHTPGPWVCYADLPSTEPNWHIVTTANKLRVLANVHIEPGNAMDEANARLIAAAPDLLEACRRAEQFIRNGIDLGFIRMPDASTPDPAQDTPGIIEAAIAKAEGRS